MLSQPIVRPLTHDLMSELRTFIGGATKTAQCNPLDLTKTALNLLKNLPAARDAVLEYFCTVFDTAAQNYVVRIETEISTGELPPVSEYDETTVAEIHTVLCSFVSGNADAWAPIISTWSLELLGEISTKYAGRAHISVGLNETLQLWMSCRATRTLIDITTQCLSCLMNSDTEACINALLDTSVKHSPNFDWVVAHVGSCFPNTVITRVLSCGLKDFCQNKSYEQGCDSPKLKSVVGILGHLAGSHCDDIRMALLNLFRWSLEPTTFQDGDPVRIQKKATVPFLLQLSNLSPTLLSAICRDIRSTVTLEIIMQLYNFIDDWCKYFGSPEALEELLVNLILKCECGGAQIVNLLLDCAFLEEVECTSEQMKETIKLYAKEILECVLQEISYSIRSQPKQNEISVNLLKSFVQDVDDIHGILLSSEKIKSETAARIIIFVGALKMSLDPLFNLKIAVCHVNPTKLVDSATFLFQNANSDNHLALLVRILSDALIDKTIQPMVDKGGYLSVVFEQILSKNCQHFDDVCNNEDPLDSPQMWQNLLKLLKWEKSNRVQILGCKLVSRAVQNNMINFTAYYCKERALPILHTLSEIFDLLNIPSLEVVQMYNPPIEVILNLTNGTVNYFFICCNEDDKLVRMQAFRRITDLLKRLCIYSKAAKTLAFKELLERAIFSKDGVLFGARYLSTPKNDTAEKLLLKQNKKMSKTIPLTKHSSVYNGGIIGTGKRKPPVINMLKTDLVSDNTQQLINVLRASCSLPPDNSNKFVDVCLDSVTQVSLQLVQFVSPDVMYNGLPWPEEEFSKVTIERDLYIRRLFSNTPLLWDLLSFVAIHRPALCFCSVLIRALTATLMHQWNSMGDQSKSSDTDSYKSLMDTTIKVIDVMALGQLLPPPLSSIRDVIPYLDSHEIFAILRECVWMYMRDHIPSPALFICDANGTYWRDPTTSRPPEQYTKTLRIIMQRNIETVAHLFSEMFINVPSS